MAKDNTAKIKHLSPVLTLGREVIDAQASALSKLSDSLNDSFENAAKAIASLNSESRVLTTGVGKAGYIARKFSASLSSIGIPSFFISSSEASHGDLGRVTKDDLIVIYSFSGETSEVISLLPWIGLNKIRCIAITKSKDSSLGRSSEITLELGDLKECPPIDAAPTTSTTAMLALSDALVMTAASLKKITRENFASLHPGGVLGKLLNPVSSFMRTGLSHCIVQENMSCRDVIHLYTKTPGRPGAASVVDTKGKLIGVFTDGNLRRLIDSGKDFLNLTIKEVMTHNPKTLSTEAIGQEAIKIMSEFKIDQLIIVDTNNIPVGLIDIQDLVSILPNNLSRDMLEKE